MQLMKIGRYAFEMLMTNRRKFDDFRKLKNKMIPILSDWLLKI